MLQVVICDDEQIALKKVKRELIRYRESRKVHFKILEYDNPELLYYDVTDGNLSEVYILDVDMPKKNGLTLVETVHEKNPNAFDSQRVSRVWGRCREYRRDPPVRDERSAWEKVVFSAGRCVPHGKEKPGGTVFPVLAQ